MGSSARNSEVIRFADYTLDLQTAELRRNGTKISLQDQPFQIFTMLWESPGQLITREELTKRLWPNGTFVDFDQSLNKAVARLREALGDDADNPRFVETLPRRGYRWIGPQVPESSKSVPKSDRDEQSLPEDSQKSSRPNLRNIRSVHLLVIALVLAVGVWWKSDWLGISSPPTRPTPIRSVAILPLQNLLGDNAKEYLVDGITDSLVTDLARITTAHVISRTSAMHYKGTHETLPEIARELKVDAIVEGSVSESEGRLRINLQLILAQTDSHLWARVYEGDPRHIPAMDNQFAQDIADQLQTSSTGSAVGSRRLVARSSSAHDKVSDDSKSVDQTATGLSAVRATSEDLYLHGLFYSSKLTKEGLGKGISYFLQAVDTDHQNKLAYVGLAESYCNMADLGFGPVKQFYLLAKAAALQALALDEGLAEAHSVLGWIIYTYEWDSGRADREFLRGIQLNPSYAAGRVWYGGYLARRGRIAESEQQLTTAAQLDPLSLPILTELYLPLYFAQRYGQAIDASQRVLDMDPNFEKAREQLIFLYELTGNVSAAVPEQMRAEILNGVAPETASKRARTLQAEISRKGPRAYWENRLKDSLERRSQNWSDPNDLVFIYLHLGKKAEALDRLEKAIRDRDAEFDIQNDPEFEGLWGEPRFQKLVAEMKPVGK